MSSNAEISSHSPTSLQDFNDRKSEKTNVDVESGEVSESERFQNQSLAGPDPDAFPDGGFHAWLCIAGGFCTVFSSFGWVNCMLDFLVNF